MRRKNQESGGPLASSRRLLAACLAASMILVGCFGSFPISTAVRKFNGEVTNEKWVHSIVMWVLIIIPVYELAFLGDIFIFNLVEFWSGDTIDVETSDLGDGRTVTVAPTPDPDVAVLTVAGAEGSITQMVQFRRMEDGSVLVTDQRGVIEGFVQPTSDGGFELLDAQRRLVSGISGADIQTARRAHLDAATPATRVE